MEQGQVAGGAELSMAQIFLEEEIQTQGRGSQAKRLLKSRNVASVMMGEVRASQFMILLGNECISWLGCSELLARSERRSG